MDFLSEQCAVLSSEASSDLINQYENDESGDGFEKKSCGPAYVACYHYSAGEKKGLTMMTYLAMASEKEECSKDEACTWYDVES